MPIRRAAASLCALSLLAALACQPPGKDGDGKVAHEAVDTPPAKTKAATKAKAKTKVKAKDKIELTPLPEEVIATIDGHPIPRSEFDVRYEPQAARILSRRTDGKVPLHFQAMQRHKIIEALVWSKLMELEAARGEVDFAPEALAEEKAKGKRHIRDWPAWLARIDQTAEIRHQANVDYVRERALSRARDWSLEPTEAELVAAYEAGGDKLVSAEEVVRASHILITYGPRVGDEKIQPMLPEQREAATEQELAQWDAAALARAQALREAALAPGVDFNELAREYSEGPGAFRGGDMGLFPRRQMVLEYTEAVFALESGQLSQPIKSDKGYYVIRSFGRYEPGPMPFEAVRADLVRQLKGQKYQQAHARLKTELEDRYTIVSPILDEARALREHK